MISVSLCDNFFFFCNRLSRRLTIFSIVEVATLATLFSHMWPRFCGGDIYSRRKPLFSSFGEHTAVCGSSVRQAVARPRHRERFCGCVPFSNNNFLCRPSVLGSATKTRPPVAKQSGQCARALIKVLTATYYQINSKQNLVCFFTNLTTL